MPPRPVFASHRFSNFSAATAGAQIKSGSGNFVSLSINTLAASSSVTLYDGTSTAGKRIGSWSGGVAGEFADLNFAFDIGLFVVITGAPDVTIGWD